MKEKNIERRKTKISKMMDRISKACKSLWIGEYAATGTSENELPVDKNEKAKFDAVIAGIHERTKSYQESMKADGKLDEVNKNRRVETRSQNVSKDRAD